MCPCRGRCRCCAAVLLRRQRCESSRFSSEMLSVCRELSRVAASPTAARCAAAPPPGLGRGRTRARRCVCHTLCLPLQQHQQLARQPAASLPLWAQQHSLLPVSALSASGPSQHTRAASAAGSSWCARVRHAPPPICGSRAVSAALVALQQAGPALALPRARRDRCFNADAASSCCSCCICGGCGGARRHGVMHGENVRQAAAAVSGLCASCRRPSERWPLLLPPAG